MPIRSVPLVVASCAAVIIVADCAADSGPRGAVVRDSAGVAIVENGSVADLPVAFRIDATPILDLGGARGDPAEELNPQAPFHDIVRLSDGRLVVPDMRDLKVFAADGRYLSTIGREGSGPGEFGQVRAACVAPGDTIIAIHYSAPRISVFDPAGEHVRTFTAAGSYIEGSGCFRDGSVLVHGAAAPEASSAGDASAADYAAGRGDRAGASPAYRTTTVRRIASDGTDLGVVATFPGGHASFAIASVSNTVPFGGQVFVGDGRHPEVQVYRDDGTLARIIRWRQDLIPVTDALLRERVRGSVPANAPEGAVAAQLRRARSRPQPPTAPAYFRIEVDGAGRVWVEDHPIASPAPRPWTVFDAAGRLLGRVELPQLAGDRFVAIRSIGRDAVVLAWRDEAFGFAHLSLHRMEAVGEGR